MAPDDAGNDHSLATGAVTFLDVLGWKGIWGRHPDPISALTALVETGRQELDSARGRFDPKVYSGTRFNLISDTIVIVSECPPDAAFDAIEAHGLMASRLIPDSILHAIPVRGATAFGRFASDANVYVGPAIDEAAAWYEQGDWIGVHLTPSALYSMDLSRSSHWRAYTPPLKTGNGWQTGCVRWPRPVEAGRDAIDLAEITRRFREMSPILPDTLPKFENTIKYLRPKGA